MTKARSSKARSGGGITSNKLVRPSIKAGPPRTNVISVAATDMMGQRVAFKRPDLIKGTAPQVPLGNDLATNVGRGAPGAGRTIYKTGFQSCHGTPAKGQTGIQGAADRGPRQILGPPSGQRTGTRGGQTE
jgi:cytochrome c5